MFPSQTNSKSTRNHKLVLSTSFYTLLHLKNTVGKRGNIYKEQRASGIRKKMVIQPKIVESEVLSIAEADESEVDIDELTEGQEASFSD